jgi:hypothetical protein
VSEREKEIAEENFGEKKETKQRKQNVLKREKEIAKENFWRKILGWTRKWKVLAMTITNIGTSA